MPSFRCSTWGPALIKLPLLELFLTFAIDWWAGLSSAQPLNFYFLGKSCICASNVLKLAPKLTLFLVGTQLSRLISDFLYLCFVGLNWNSIFCASFCKYECFVLYFTDQIPIFSLVTKLKCSVPSLLAKFRFSVSFLSNFKCSVLLWVPRFKCSVLSLGTKFHPLLWTKSIC